jgi:alpha-1,2-mannosyltransferase
MFLTPSSGAWWTRHGAPLPFAYPPSMRLLIWPLALMPPVAALLLWLGVSLVLYLWACWHRPWGRWIAIAGLVAPSTLAAQLCAQTPLMAANLMIGGCRLAGRRPILAGLLFRLLAAVKPQFGLLLPVALVSLKQWRSIAAAGATFGVTAAAGIAAFGWTAWASFPTAMLDLSRLVARDAGFDSGSPTVIEGLRLLGFRQAQAEVGQLVAAVCTAIVIWVCCRRGPMALALAAVMVGAFLVTPYASAYDLPLASYRVLAVVIERHKSNVPFKTVELFILILVMALPVVMMFHPLHVPWGAIALASLLALIVRSVLLLPPGGRDCPA